MKMKFIKPGSNVSAKTKTSLTDKSKFKSKEAVAQNGKLQKSVKHAGHLIKKGSLDEEVVVLVKNDNNGISLKKQKKKQPSKPTQLSPKVKIGLKVDKPLQQKIKKQNGSMVDSSPSISHSNNQTTSQSDSSPKANKKKKRGKKKSNAQNLPKSNETNFGPVANTNISKKAKKRKGGSVAQSESDSSPAKKVESVSTDVQSKSIKKKKAKTNLTGNETVQTEKSEEDNSSPINDSKDFSLTSKDVLKAVKSLIDIFKKNQKPSTKLLDSEHVPIFLNFLFFIPHNKHKIIRFDLAKSLVTDNSDICMFVSDIAKRNIDESKAQWEQIFRDEKVTNLTEVIPLRSLVIDYNQYQDKRKLSERFDFFLVDGKISHRVFGLLGSKYFHTRRKTPTPVKLKKDTMAECINKALFKTVAQYLSASESFSIQVGHTGMKEKEVERNVMKVWEQYPEQFGVYWENIRKASLLIPKITPLPIFFSLNPPKTAPRVFKSMKWVKDFNNPVVGELSTAINKQVLVYPTGDVIVKDMKKQKGKQQKKMEKINLKELKKQNGSDDTESLDSDDDLEGRADMLQSESDSEDEPPPKKKSAGVKETKANQKKGKQVKPKPDDDDDDDDESIVDQAELLYLKDLAASKKTKKAKGAAITKQQAVSSSDGDSDDSNYEEVDSAEEEDDDMDSNVSIAGSSDDSNFDLDSDEEEPSNKGALKKVLKKPIGKSIKNQQKKNGNIKGGMKMNGGAKSPSKKQKKTGATKNVSPQKQNKKKPNQSAANPMAQQATSSKKKASPSFQGVQANPKKKNKKQGLNPKQAKTAQVFKQKVK